MPVHLKILIYTFTFSENLLLKLQDDSQGQYVCLRCELDHEHGRSPFLQFFLSLSYEMQVTIIYCTLHGQIKGTANVVLIVQSKDSSVYLFL